jgi:hypothetical protein
MLMRNPTLVFLATLLPASLALSDADKGNTNKEPCHMLMTQQECTQFRATLAKLPAGPARNRMLEGNARLIKEREAACSCEHMREVVYLSELPGLHKAF